jgi:glycosyltransferase involved in cell wall biosynthesis
MCQALSVENNEVLLLGKKHHLDKTSDDNVFSHYGLKRIFKLHLIRIPKVLTGWLVAKSKLQNIYFSFKIRRFINRFQPEYIYSRLTLFELLFIPHSTPVIYEMHSLGYLGRGILKRFIFKVLLKIKNIKKIVVTTDYLAEKIKKLLPNIVVTTARLSAELPESHPTAQVEQYVTNNLIIKKKFKYHIGYTGSFDTSGLRGIEIILKIAEHISDCAFHIIGGTNELVEYWQHKASQYNRYHNIYIYSYKKTNEIPFILQFCEIMLAPLQYRPTKSAPTGSGMSPLKISQYMAYGKPIIASDIPAHRELLTNNQSAILVPPEDVDAWVCAIKRLVTDKQRKSELSTEASSYYLNKLTPSKRVQSILNDL